MNKISSAINFVKRARKPFDYKTYFNKCSLNKIACVKTTLAYAIRSKNAEAFNKLRKNTLLKCAECHFKFQKPFIKKAGPWDGNKTVGGEVGVPYHMLSPNADNTYSNGAYGPSPDYVQRRQQIIDQHEREVAEAEAKAAEEKAKAEKEYENLRRSYYVECLLDGYTPEEALSLVDRMYSSFDEWMASQEYNEQPVPQEQEAPTDKQMYEAGYDKAEDYAPPGFGWMTAPDTWITPYDRVPVITDPADEMLSITNKALNTANYVTGYDKISLDNLPPSAYMFPDPDIAQEAVLHSFIDPLIPAELSEEEKEQKFNYYADMFTNPSEERIADMRYRINSGTPTQEDLMLGRFVRWNTNSRAIGRDHEVLNEALIRFGENFIADPPEPLPGEKRYVYAGSNDAFTPGVSGYLPNWMRAYTFGYGYPTLDNAFFGGKYTSETPDKQRSVPPITAWYTNGKLNTVGLYYKNNWLNNLPEKDYVNPREDNGYLVAQFNPDNPAEWGFQVPKDPNKPDGEQEWYFTPKKTEEAFKSLGLPLDATDDDILNASGYGVAPAAIANSSIPTYTGFGTGGATAIAETIALVNMLRGGRGRATGGANVSGANAPATTPAPTTPTNNPAPIPRLVVNNSPRPTGTLPSGTPSLAQASAQSQPRTLQQIVNSGTTPRPVVHNTSNPAGTNGNGLPSLARASAQSPATTPAQAPATTPTQAPTTSNTNNQTTNNTSWRSRLPSRRNVLRGGGWLFGAGVAGNYEGARFFESQYLAPELRAAQHYLALRYLWLKKYRETTGDPLSAPDLPAYSKKAPPRPSTDDADTVPTPDGTSSAPTKSYGKDIPSDPVRVPSPSTPGASPSAPAKPDTTWRKVEF